MASERALPDLIARLKLDTHDLERAAAAGKGMDRDLQAAAAGSSAGLRRVQDESGRTRAHVGLLGNAFAGLRASTTGVVSAFVGFVGPLAGVGLGVGGLYAALNQAIVPAAGFEQQMTKLVGTAGESRDVLKSVSDGILQMAGEVGYGAGQLADGMYLVESAGFHGAAGLNVLRQSAMAAKAENADLPTVANAVTTALNAYGFGADKAAHVTDVLLTATSQGKMTFQDLAGSLDQVLPSASAARIGLNEVAAAIATQTAQGTPAAVAATNLQYAIKGLEVTTSTSGAAIEALGVKSTRFSNELVTKGLLPTLNDLTTVVGKKFPEGSAGYDAAISNILGNQEGLNAVLQLSGVHAQTFAADLTGMGASAGKTKDSFDEMMATTGGRWSRFTSGLQADAIRVGTVALPVLNQLIDALDARLAPALSRLAPVTASVISGAGMLASGKRNVGQTVQAGLEGAGLTPEQAASISGPITDIASTIGPAFARMLAEVGPDLREITRLLLAIVPPALLVTSQLLGALAPAIGVLTDHGNLVVPVLAAIAAEMVIVKAALAVGAISDFAGAFVDLANEEGLASAAIKALGVEQAVTTGKTVAATVASKAVAAADAILTAGIWGQSGALSASAVSWAAHTAARGAARTAALTLSVLEGSLTLVIGRQGIALIGSSAAWVANTIQKRAAAVTDGIAGGASAVLTAGIWSQSLALARSTAARVASRVAALASAVAEAVLGSAMAASTGRLLANTVGWVANTVGQVANRVASAASTVALYAVTGAQVASNIVQEVGLVGLIAMTAAKVAGAIATGAITVATVIWTAAQWGLNVALDANPIGIVVIAIVALVLVVALLITHWQQVVQWVTTAWNTFDGFENSLGPFRGAFEALLGPIGAVLGLAKTLHDNWSTVTGIFNDVAGAVRSAWDTLAGFAGAAGRLWSSIKGSLPGPVQSALGFAEGGIVPGYAPGRDSVPALLSPGEAVLRPEATRALGAGTIAQLNAVRFADGGVVGGSPAAGTSIVNHFHGVAADPQALAAMVASEQRWSARVSARYR